MKYLITGGSGFIGSHLATYLLNKNHTVYIVDNLSTGTLKNITHLKNHPHLFFSEGDVRTLTDLPELVAKVDGIFHLAASVGVKNIIQHPLQSTLNTSLAGHRILELANTYHKKILITSSSEVYGFSKKKVFTETDTLTLGPSKLSRWSYAATKIVEEHLALAYYAEHALPVVVVRLFNTVGEKQSSQYGMVIPTFIKQAQSNQPLTIFGDGSQSRCFTYVGDVVWALAHLIENQQAIGEIINIGATEVISINELADKIIQLTHSQSVKTYTPYTALTASGYQDVSYRKPNIAKAKKIIGFTPVNSTESILRKILSLNSSST